MTAHDRRATSTADALVRSSGGAKHSLAKPETLRLSRQFVVFTPMVEEVNTLLDHARREMGVGAESSVVHRVIRRNPDSFWAIAYQSHFTREAPCAQGYVAFLMLNRKGVEALIDGAFEGTNPDLSMITRQNEKPVGIYFWGVYAHGPFAGAVPLAFEKVSTPLYRDADLYARPVTLGGYRLLKSLGFHRGATFSGKLAPDLYMYSRTKPEHPKAPVYDSYGDEKEKDAVSITVARSLDDFMRVSAVRSAVYIAEQDCPYLEEFDGNDFSGSHLLGYVGGEPAGCLRIRYFGEFAKLERLAVRHEFRHRQLGTRLMRAGIQFCRAKGFKKIYGRGRKEILDYYLKLGFRPLEGGQELIFSDHAYVEIVYDAPPNPDAIKLGIDPYVLLRPEGRWHIPGILEESASRPTRLSTERVSA